MLSIPLVALTTIGSAYTQSDSAGVYHDIEGILHFSHGRAGGVQVRLYRQSGFRLIAETFSRTEGQFSFKRVVEDEYVVETRETDKFEATSTSVAVRPFPRNRPTTFYVMVDVPLKRIAARPAPGVVAADVDLNVTKEARKHFDAGMKAIAAGNSEKGIAELEAAIAAYPAYYAARLELARELRAQKRYDESEETLKPLLESAARRVEPRVEYGILLITAGRRDEAVTELNKALEIEEPNWAIHFYLGWALLEKNGEQAKHHFERALVLDERKAARAHLPLARLANEKGERQTAIKHLDAYVAAAPKAADAEQARKLAERLRSDK
jgi:Tfp pilus assembly protein PilF